MNAKVLILLLPTLITDEQVAKAIGRMTPFIKEGTTPILLNESDFIDTVHKTTNRFNVRKEFELAVDKLIEVCGDPKEEKFYFEFLKAYAQGYTKTSILNILKTTTPEELAWLSEIKATYLIAIIERAESLFIKY